MPMISDTVGNLIPFMEGRMSRPVSECRLVVLWGGSRQPAAGCCCFAHLPAREQACPVARAHRLDRFPSGHLIDENGRGAQPNLH